MGENKRVITKWLYWFVFAVAVILVYKTVDNLGEILNWFGKLFSILMPFVIGILIAYLFYIPTKKLEKVYSRTKNKFIKRKSRAIAIFTIYVIAIIAIIFIINFIIPTIIAVVLIDESGENKHDATIPVPAPVKKSTIDFLYGCLIFDFLCS